MEWSTPELVNEEQMERSTSKMTDEERKKITGELYTHTFKGEWGEVVKLYETKPEVWSVEITSSGDTALHMVINEDKEDVVAKLVNIIDQADNRYKEKKVEALKKANDVGETPLHRAAARGSLEMCECIVGAATKYKCVDDLLRIANKWGENPIFVAVVHNRRPAFIFLFEAADKLEHNLLQSPLSGDTILHSAIRREHYDLAFHITNVCPVLVEKYNVKGLTPLHILASKPSYFLSGYNLSWWKAIIYHSIRVDQLEYGTLRNKSSKIEHPENHRTCYQFFSSLRCGENMTGVGDPEKHHVKGNVPQNYTTWFQFLFIVLHNLFGVIGFGNVFNEIVKARQKHTWSAQILDEMMKNPAKTYMTKGGGDPGGSLEDFGDSHLSPGTLPYSVKKTTQGETNEDGSQRKNDTTQKGAMEVVNKILERLGMEGEMNEDESQRKTTDTALLVAAQKGVVEVVNKILDRLPVSIHDTSSNNKNIVLVAVENRQPKILKALYKHLNEELEKPKLWQDLIQAVDADDNTVLHLAAKYDDSKSHPWQIHGVAMQMQWEIKWYEHVKSLLPPHFVFLTNKREKTPAQIFTKDHNGLVKSSSEWLKDTSESCSVVAALVAGVSFATSSQVPGGTDDSTGRPKLEGQPAFELFAVTALIGLCFSVTALVMFLSILTSRKQHKDFKRNLPMKLLLGLSSLFVAIASMLVSFCAAHFFVLEDKFKKGVFPLYAATCLPLSFYAIAQFPLYAALLKAIVRKVPQSYHYGYI